MSFDRSLARLHHREVYTPTLTSRRRRNASDTSDERRILSLEMESLRQSRRPYCDYCVRAGPGQECVISLNLDDLY